MGRTTHTRYEGLHNVAPSVIMTCMNALMDNAHELPAWFPDHKVLGPAIDGGWVLRVSNVSKEAKRLAVEGWRLTPSGPRHVLARKR